MVYSRPTSSSSHPPTKLYFAYGSNLWLHQMHLRCPSAQYIGLAKLTGYKWIISQRGYANVVETSSSSASKKNGKDDGEYDNVVYGMLYSLTPSDEEKLDKNEGVPIAYTKEDLECDIWLHQPGPVDPAFPHLINPIDTTTEPSETKELLVYVDRVRVEEGESREEYVHRMNEGIKDAVGCGMPERYVRGVLRRFIREERDGEIGEKEGREKAERQARGFRDESGVF
jgi:gamma-glutamylcyclotransferase